MLMTEPHQFILSFVTGYNVTFCYLFYVSKYVFLIVLYNCIVQYFFHLYTFSVFMFVLSLNHLSSKILFIDKSL